MKKLLVIAACVSMLCPAFVQAAGTATVTGTMGRTAHVYWQNESLVLRQPAHFEPARVMLRGGHVYFVYSPGTSPRVVEMSGMLNKLRQAQGTGQRPLSKLLNARISVEATGQTETVAGIKGHVFRVTVLNDDRSKTYRTVLTDNPTVESLTRLVADRASSVMGEQAHWVARAFSALPDAYHGVLKFGQVFQLTRVTSKDPANRRFELPAQPVSYVQAMIMRMADQMFGSGKTQ